jgi:hypothetical protein
LQDRPTDSGMQHEDDRIDPRRQGHRIAEDEERRRVDEHELELLTQVVEHVREVFRSRAMSLSHHGNR